MTISNDSSRRESQFTAVIDLEKQELKSILNLFRENKKLVEDTRKKVRDMLKGYTPNNAANDTYIKDKIRNEIGKFLYQKTERRPMVLPVIIEV